jgi:hypothetical protein
MSMEVLLYEALLLSDLQVLKNQTELELRFMRDAKREKVLVIALGVIALGVAFMAAARYHGSIYESGTTLVALNGSSGPGEPGKHGEHKQAQENEEDEKPTRGKVTPMGARAERTNHAWALRPPPRKPKDNPPEM